MSVRFIPAFTGNGIDLNPVFTALTVYPRIHGEREEYTWVARNLYGLSPHSRGTGRLGILSLVSCRFIPAFTGNGLAVHAQTGTSPVYPRIHGERIGIPLFALCYRGLSPHSRGTGLVTRRAQERERFIPAFTGNGLIFRLWRHRSTVYPRIHGERCVSRGSAPFQRGLSPHSRGTATSVDRTIEPQRFIPAFTGNGVFFVKMFLHVAVYPRIHGERALEYVSA